MFRRLLPAACLLALMFCGSYAAAAEKATTSELPAALQALGADESKIMTQSEAEEVRGEVFLARFNITHITGGSATVINFRGIFNSIGIVLGPGGVAIGIQ